MTEQNSEKGTIAIYGPTKIGKTLDVCHCFRNALVLLTERGGLDSVQSNLGYTPDHVKLMSIENPFKEAIDALDGAVKKALSTGKYKSIVLDTGSELADRLLDPLMTRHHNDARRAYPECYRQFKAIIRRLMAWSNLWLVVIFHEAKPKTTENKYEKGGPKLPGALTEDVPSLFSTILRATYGDADDRVYQCDALSSQCIMGDRFGVADLEQPMDLRPLVWQMAFPDKPVPAFPPKPIRKVERRTESEDE
jgi:hypothetical protein